MSRGTYSWCRCRVGVGHQWRASYEQGDLQLVQMYSWLMRANITHRAEHYYDPTHRHAHTHTHTRVHTHVCIHMYCKKGTHRHTHTHTHIRAYTCVTKSHAQTHTHTRMHAHTNTLPPLPITVLKVRPMFCVLINEQRWIRACWQAATDTFKIMIILKIRHKYTA